MEKNAIEVMKEMYHQGCSYKYIAEQLTDLGYRRESGKEYSKTDVSHALIGIGLRRHKEKEMSYVKKSETQNPASRYLGELFMSDMSQGAKDYFLNLFKESK